VKVVLYCRSGRAMSMGVEDRVWKPRWPIPGHVLDCEEGGVGEDAHVEVAIGADDRSRCCRLGGRGRLNLHQHAIRRLDDSGQHSLDGVR